MAPRTLVSLLVSHFILPLNQREKAEHIITVLEADLAVS